MSDDFSLKLIEEAIGVYRNAPMLSPDKAHEVIREACSLIDLELMRLPLEQAAWPGGGPDMANYPARFSEESSDRADY